MHVSSAGGLCALAEEEFQSGVCCLDSSESIEGVCGISSQVCAHNIVSYDVGVVDQSSLLAGTDYL